MRRFRRRNRSASATNRGQAALIGLVLLIGMVATVSVGIFLIAGDTVEQTEQEAETERVEGAFVELSQMMRSVASSSDTSSQVDLDLSDSGAVVMKNTSTMSIEYGDDDPTDVDFGTIEYEGDDGTRIAYQGGAVFKETGNETQIVSAPPVSYVDDDGSETLSFPILEPTEEGSISSGEISATKEDNATVEFSETIDDGEVTINITGPYYRGWEEHFERQAGEDAIDSIDAAGDVTRGDLQPTVWLRSGRDVIGGLIAGVYAGLRARRADRSYRRNPNGVSTRHDRAVQRYDRR